MFPIGVECTFSSNGTVRVRRVEMGGKWQVVEQGRQWVDENGRHVLVMLPGNLTREIVFSPRTLTWQLLSSRSDKQVV